MAEGIDDIRKQLVNNRIDTEELKERLQSGIADPLRESPTICSQNSNAASTPCSRPWQM